MNEIIQSIDNGNNSLQTQFTDLMRYKPNQLWMILEAIRQDYSKFDYTTYQKIATIFVTKHKPKTIPEKIKRTFLSFEYINACSQIYPPERMCRNVRKLILDENMKATLRTVTFSRTLPAKVSSYAFNYSKFLRNTTSTELRALYEQCCNCHKSQYKDAHHKHIVTGNLEALDNPYLESLFRHGASHRQITDSSITSPIKQCIEALQSLLALLRRKHKELLDESILSTIYDKEYDNIVKVISHYVRNKDTVIIKPTEDRNIAQNHLRTIHQKFILVPIDKASNTIGIICKKYYSEIIDKELGISYNTNKERIITGNDTYKPTSHSLSYIIDHHNRYTQRYCREELHEDNQTIATLWPTLKCHKNPVKFRFIAGARLCTTKQTALVLTNILTMMRNHFISYTDTIRRQRGYSFSWSIKNSAEVVAKTKLLRSNGKLTIADFSTLYTSFEHETIMKCMHFLVELLFKNSRNKYIATTKNGAYYHSDERGNRQRLLPNDVSELIHFIVANSYVKHAGQIFHQTKGLPMGGNASPLLADLCLSILEYKYIMSHPLEGRRLNMSMRYIDDILTLNSNALAECYHEIYPSSLPLSFDDTSDGTGHFLDLHLDRNKGSIDLYDKRVDFSFEVIRFTSASSNCPRTIGTNTMYSQIIRIARICSKRKDFLRNLHSLIEAQIQKGYTIEEIKRTMSKLNNKYQHILKPFQLNTRRLVNNWLKEANFQ